MKISEYGKKSQFSSENQPANKGRKPSKLKAYIVDTGIGADDLKVIARYFFEKTRAEIRKMAEDQNLPILISGVAKALLSDILKGRVDVISWLAERGFGKAIQPIEHTGGIDPVQDMSYQDRKKYLDDLIARRGKNKDAEEKNNDQNSLQGGGGAVSKPVISISGEPEKTVKVESEKAEK